MDRVATHWLCRVSHLKFQWALYVTEWRFIGHLIVLFSDLPPACRGTARTHAHTHRRHAFIFTDGQMFGRVFEWLCAQHANNGGCLQLKQAVIPPFMLSWARRWRRAYWDQFCEASIVTVGIVYWLYKTHRQAKCCLIKSLKMNTHLSYS